MKNKAFILILFLPLFLLRAEDNVSSLSLQAAAFMEAHDYAAASTIYEQLLAQPLPKWQQARLLYNLGTIRLAQQQPVEALKLFQKIQPTDLSLSYFGRNLLLNEGIAYLQYAQTALPAEQAIFIEQSLKAFDQALKLECQAQKEEDSSSSCQTSLLLNQWIQTARSQLDHIHQHPNSVENIDQKDEINSPANILRQALAQAELALQMFLKMEFTTKNSSQEELQAILKQQQNVLVQAHPFLPTVLDAQEKDFQQKKNCQQSPWSQVIPLYDRGYRSAQAAAQKLDQASLDAQLIIAYQKQTIQNWQQALKLILLPPQPSPSSASQKLTENFGLIQEMYLQDQSQPAPKIEEMHSW